MMQILVDPEVSKIKFNREVQNLIKQYSSLRKRGWIIESTTFPKIQVTFLAMEIIPPLAPLTVEIDFTNYNLWAPSIKFMHPISFMPIYLPGLRLVAGNNPQNMIVESHPKTKEPFICIPGAREYHSHPQHNGNSWDLHRYTGEGTLYFLLENIWIYCIKSIKQYAINVHVNTQIIDFVREAQQ